MTRRILGFQPNNLSCGCKRPIEIPFCLKSLASEECFTSGVEPSSWFEGGNDVRFSWHECRDRIVGIAKPSKPRVSIGLSVIDELSAANFR